MGNHNKGRNDGGSGIFGTASFSATRAVIDKFFCLLLKMRSIPFISWPVVFALWTPLAFPAIAWAGGFSIAGQGARAMAKSAVIADSGQPSSVVYNPAGIAAVEGLHLSAGLSLISPKLAFDGDDESAEASSSNSYIPYGALTYAIADGYTVGLGFSIPFGFNLDWPKDSPGRFEIREQALQSFAISPAVALDASAYVTGLSFGVALDLVAATFFFDRDIRLGNAEGQIRFGGDAFGAGGRIGVLYLPEAVAGLSLGLAWRSPMSLGFRGTADFDVKEDEPRSALPADSKAYARMDLPQSLLFGLAFAPFDSFNLALDFNWFGWSSFEELALELDNGSVLESSKDWNNSMAVRFGMELDLGIVGLQAGYAWDQSPIPDGRVGFSSPTGDQNIVSGGVELDFGGFTLAGAGAYIFPTSRANGGELSGTFDTSAWLVNVTVGVAFDTADVVEKPGSVQQPDT